MNDTPDGTLAEREWTPGCDAAVARIDARILRAQMRGDHEAAAALYRERMGFARDAIARHDQQ